MVTPITWERYTANRRGSYEGWLIAIKPLAILMSKTLPVPKNFYMAGQQVEPGDGMPTAVMLGRNVIQIICRGDKEQFITMVP